MKTLETCTTINSGDRRLLVRLKKVVRGFVPSATILLYGSVARGSQEANSDYDLLILTDRSLSTEEETGIRDSIYDLELEHGVLISTIFYSVQEWNMPVRRAMPFHENVEKDAVIL